MDTAFRAIEKPATSPEINGKSNDTLPGGALGAHRAPGLDPGQPGGGSGPRAWPTDLAADRVAGSWDRPVHRPRKGARSGDEVRRRAYVFASLSDYRAADRFLIRLLDLAFYFMILVIGLTIRWEVEGSEHLDSIYSRNRRAIFTFWHSCIFPATWFWRKRGIVVMSSRSRDGEYIARFIQRFGYGAARGSSSRGAGRALAEMVECLDAGIDVAFTIDGPRGPAYVAKRGATILARHTGHEILPFHISLARFANISSWDRLQIPMPFTRAIMLIGRPIAINRQGSDQEAEREHLRLQETLEALRAQGECWRANPRKA